MGNVVNQSEMTLLSCIEKVVQLAIDNKLSEEFYNEANGLLEQIAQRLEITSEQALVFSLFIEKSNERRITISDFADMIGCRTTRLIAMMGEADKLFEKGFVNRFKRDNSCYYTVPMGVIEAVKENRKFTPKSIAGLSSGELYDCVNDVFEADHDDEFMLEERLRELIEANPELPIAQAFKRYNLWSGIMVSGLMMCVYLNRFINHDDDMVGTHDWEDYFTRAHRVRGIGQCLKEGTHPLCEAGLVEPCQNDGMADPRYFHLTDKAKREFCPDVAVSVKDAAKDKRLTPYTSFAPKRLFYGKGIQSQIDQLTALLQPEMFHQVTDRLAENGMRRGFACLFYGAPGTGKTETVNQIARITQRDVMLVDISNIKSCWVGESEKNIKAAFDHYRQLVARSERAPILLFNEADAILGKRDEGAERAVDKMENAIQNIILQEMEQLEGIMIATTNLTKNLDKAFERRFIYKIEFERPTIEARTAIWQSMIPNLDEGVALSLAAQYDFSGGQIENIARKRTVSLILNGAEPSAEQLNDFCRAEILSHKPTEHRKIGF